MYAADVGVHYEHTDTTIVTIPHIHHIIRLVSIRSNTNKVTQLPPTLALPLKHPQKLPLGCEDLDAMVIPVSDIHIPSIVTGYTKWVFKLSLAIAKGAEEAEVRV